MSVKRSKKTEEARVIKPKFMAERQSSLTPLVPLNERQAEYIDLIRSKRMIIAMGLPGTSKTYIPTVMAADMLRKGEIKKIYLVRPAISNSQSLGFFPGSMAEKMSPWLMPVLSIMHKRLGKEVVDMAIAAGNIEFLPLEVIKGMSLGADTFTIIDESEDISQTEFISIVSRQNGGILVLAGDIQQSALGPDSGLSYALKLIKNNPHLLEYTGVIDFNHPNDIVRSKECKQWIMAVLKDCGQL